MSAIASQITSLTIVNSTIYLDADERNINAPRHWPYVGNSPVTGEFPAQMASDAENVSIWWRHHDLAGFGAHFPTDIQWINGRRSAATPTVLSKIFTTNFYKSIVKKMRDV